MKTWKDIERARERRLWIKEVIFPSVIMGAAAWNIPEVRECVKGKFNDVKNFIRSKFKKEEK